MNPVRNHPLRLLEFCFLTLLFLLTRGSSACVPLLSACTNDRECCKYPDVVCRAGTCYIRVHSCDQRYNDAMESVVYRSNKEWFFRQRLIKAIQKDLTRGYRENSTRAISLGSVATTRG
nr:PREDICTED: uncharacterized protein LOC109033902 isoform X3 [Bemisia tabaci]